MIRRSAMGPLLGIMPWNFPYYQVARFAGPNLIVGNPILLKPAPQCPESAEAIQKMYDDVGLPEGGTRRSSRPRADRREGDPRPARARVSVTGSERAGAAVAEVAGRNLKKVVLEMGGSDPFIVLATQNLDEVVDAAVEPRLDNTGQSCNAAKRFIVVDELYDDFLAKLTEKMKEVEPGDPAPGLGDGATPSSTAAERLQDQIDRAKAQGAEAVLDGDRKDNFFGTTVLTGISPESDAYREEFFGPVASVYRVSSEEEAIRVANDTPFGLGSFVFTTDPEQGDRVANDIEAGMVFVNGVLLDGAELPFGGVKRSGFGRELGPYGMDEFVNEKLIRVVSSAPPLPRDARRVATWELVEIASSSSSRALAPTRYLPTSTVSGSSGRTGRVPQVPGLSLNSPTQPSQPCSAAARGRGGTRRASFPLAFACSRLPVLCSLIEATWPSSIRMATP